jgi:hypothetical protein
MFGTKRISHCPDRPGLKDSKCRLKVLEAEHPDDGAVRAALDERGLEAVMKVRRSPHPRLLAHLVRPDGAEVTFSSG